jgi:hypothetical protein
MQAPVTIVAHAIKCRIWPFPSQKRLLEPFGGLTQKGMLKDPKVQKNIHDLIKNSKKSDRTPNY